MIFDVVFEYEAEIVRQKKRKPEDVLFTEECHVEVAEVSADEAPLVLRMPAPDVQYNMDPPEVDIRYKDGKFWRQPYVHFSSHGEETPLTLEGLKELVSARKTAYGRAPHTMPQFWKSKYSGWKKVESPDNPEIRLVHSTGRETALEAIRVAASRMLIIDGQVFVETPEPVLKIEYHVGGYQGLLPIPYVIPLPGEGRDRDQCFRADRGVDAADVFETHVGPFGPGEREAFLASLPDVRMPDVLTYDDEGEVFLRLIQSGFDPLGGMLRDGSKNFLMAYADLRDALAELRRGERDLHELTPAVQYMRDVIAAEHGEHRSADSFSNALERWERFRGAAPDVDLLSGMAP